MTLQEKLDYFVTKQAEVVEAHKKYVESLRNLEKEVSEYFEIPQGKQANVVEIALATLKRQGQ